MGDKNESKDFTLAVGIMSEKLSVQLKNQGFTMPKDLIVIYEKFRCYLITMKINGIITDGESKRIGKRLADKIATEVEWSEK